MSTGLAVVPTQESEMTKTYSRDFHGTKVRHLPNGGIEITKSLGPKQTRTDYRPTQPASGGTECFPAHTRVLTPTGWRAISTIKAGDAVLSRPADSTALVSRKVTAVKQHGASELLAIRTSLGNDALLVTRVHSLLTAGGVWRRAEQLQVGDQLVVPGDGQERTIQVTSIMPGGTAPAVFNLHTAVDHNFIVEHGNAGGVLAHNFSYMRTLRVLMHRALFDRTFATTQPASA